MIRALSVKFRSVLLASFVLVLLAALACGASATSTPRPSATAIPQPVATSAPAPSAMAPAATAAPRATARPGPTARPVATAMPAATRAPTATPRPTTAPTAMAGPKLEKVVIALVTPAHENNWPWLVTASGYTQFTPIKEFLIHINENGELVPGLATKWEMAPDGKSWTYDLRKGVPYHGGFGDFSARDVVHSVALQQREDSIVRRSYWKRVHPEIINDNKVVLRLDSPDADLDTNTSQTVELLQMSKAHWDSGQMDALKERIIGTGPYEFKDRSVGSFISFETVGYKHWRITPDFPTLELRYANENSTRLAMLLAGEAQAASLPTDLQNRAEAQGMENVRASFPNSSLIGIFGGMYSLAHLTPGKGCKDPPCGDFDPTLPWNDIKVRQAFNHAINRKELIDNIIGENAVLSQIHQFLSHRGQLGGLEPGLGDKLRAGLRLQPRQSEAAPGRGRLPRRL